MLKCALACGMRAVVYCGLREIDRTDMVLIKVIRNKGSIKSSQPATSCMHIYS